MTLHAIRLRRTSQTYPLPCGHYQKANTTTRCRGSTCSSRRRHCFRTSTTSPRIIAIPKATSNCHQSHKKSVCRSQTTNRFSQRRPLQRPPPMNRRRAFPLNHPSAIRNTQLHFHPRKPAVRKKIRRRQHKGAQQTSHITTAALSRNHALFDSPHSVLSTLTTNSTNLPIMIILRIA